MIDQDDLFVVSLVKSYARDLSLSEQRGLILHLLYTAECHDYLISPEALAYQYDIGFNVIIEHEDAVFKNLAEILPYRDKADIEIAPLLKNWKFDRISVMTKLILRYAFWELKEKKSDPALVINEAVELAKSYGESDSYRFIHGILDSWVKKQSV